MRHWKQISAPKRRFLLVHLILVAVLAMVLPAKPETIVLSKSFDHGAAEAFEMALTDTVDTVFLSVSGGYLVEGMEIGRIIRARGLRTVVPAGATCLSACAEAVLGGVTIVIDGTVAFHIPRSERTFSRQNAFEQGFAGGTLTAIYRHEMGFGFRLTQTINRWTTTERLLVFSSAEELMRYKDPKSGIILPRFYQN